MVLFSAENGIGPDAGACPPGSHQGQRTQRRQYQEGFVEDG